MRFRLRQFFQPDTVKPDFPVRILKIQEQIGTLFDIGAGFENKLLICPWNGAGKPFFRKPEVPVRPDIQSGSAEQTILQQNIFQFDEETDSVTGAGFESW